MLDIGHIWYVISLCFRPLWKWFLHTISRLSELQRVCYGAESGAPRTIGVETSLMLSRSKAIRELVSLLDQKASKCTMVGSSRSDMVDGSVLAILQVKRIKSEIHPAFAPALAVCVDKIWQYRQLKAQLETFREIKYASSDPEHERRLLRLWELLQPSVSLSSRVSSQWKDVGFQGDDPATDFRGMGLLGLESLLYMAESHSDIALHVLCHSHHPNYGYSFAIVGINLCHLALELVRTNLARPHFYNLPSNRAIALTEFFAFFVYIFHRFDQLWLDSRPRDIMEFGRIRDQFANNIRNLLTSPSANLDIRPVVVKV